MRSQQNSDDLMLLYRILEAGEKGYAVSAANVNNRGLKALFKSYAQQRAMFKSEVLLELRHLLGYVRPRRSLRGFIHRGRITIFATLTIGDAEREKVVLKEILIGERAALQAYEMVLRNGLPDSLRDRLAHQYYAVRAAFDQIQLLRGREGKHLVLRLFDSDQAAESAMRELAKAGFDTGIIERVDFIGNFEAYEGENSTLAETTVSGAVGGAFWGSLVGTLSGIGLDVADLVPFGMAPGEGLWTLFSFAGIAAGALIGAILGFAIGVGIRGEDAHLYNQSLQRGKVILVAMVDTLRAKEAGQIMAYISARGWAGTMPV
jgi:uncharacterized protein (TIGR02284 family)